MKYLIALTFTCANLIILGGCGGGNSSNNTTASTPSITSASSAADLDAKVTTVNSSCTKQGLQAFAVPSGAREVSVNGSINGTYEFADSKLLVVSASPNGNKAIILVSTTPNGNGTYSNSTDCNDVVTSGDTATAVNGNLSAPLKTVGDGMGSTISTGSIKVTASKSKYSDTFDVNSDVDATKIQNATREQTAAASNSSNPNILGKAYLTDDGSLIIIMRLNVSTDGTNLMGEYILIHMKKTN